MPLRGHCRKVRTGSFHHFFLTIFQTTNLTPYTNEYKTSVNTYGEIVGRHDNDVPISNTATDVILSSK